MHTNETSIHDQLEQPASPEPREEVQPAVAEKAVCGRRRLRVKLCPACELEKPLLAFHRTAEGPERHRAVCRSCELAAKRRQPQVPAGSKQCRHCREVRPMRSFAGDTRCRDGRATVCNDCQGAVRSERVGEAPASLENPDELLGRNTLEKEQRTALGIAIAYATCPPGHCRSRQELAAYAEVSVEAIRLIESRALEKVQTRVAAVLLETGYTLREVLR
jgi:hypothetical protein